MTSTLRLFLFITSFFFIGFHTHISKADSLTQKKSPFTSEKYFSDSYYIRAIGLGEKVMLSDSRALADQAAIQQLQNEITSILQTIHSNFISEYDLNTEIEQTLKNTYVHSVKNINSEVIDSDEYYSDKSGYYKSWRAHQVSKQSILQTIEQTLEKSTISSEIQKSYLKYIASEM